MSTHVPHKRYDQDITSMVSVERISTHVPHKRYDWDWSLLHAYWMISTHVPHKRYDLAFIVDKVLSVISTHVPHKRYDTGHGRGNKYRNHFNSRTSQEVRPSTFTLIHLLSWISTHVPHKRYDAVLLKCVRIHRRFQLTYLTRGTTVQTSRQLLTD